MSTFPPPSGNIDDNSSLAEDSIGEEPGVESLVNGRQKRATAGNRLSLLLEKEGDDELELLFAEDEEEEDIEFEDEGEDASDAQLDSSTDEEDQSPTKIDDELLGEKELQNQDRLERQKKRKAHEVFKRPGALRKKVKIDASMIPTTPAPKPKKSERVSWLHTEAEPPTRASSRKQTVQNRELVHQKLADSEQSRLKVMHQMEEAQKRKDALRPKALTQADRIEEAAKTERKNARSLNRWEESEKKRSEEQKAKLEALHNRQLTGPVIAWWSGLARWVNGKIGQLGVKEIRGAGHTEKAVATLDNETSGPDPKKVLETSPSGTKAHNMVKYEASLVTHIPPQAELQNQHQARFPPHQDTFVPTQGPYGFLDGIHAYAALPMQQHQAEFTGTAEGDLSPDANAQTRFPEQSGPGQPTEPSEKLLAPEIEFTSRSLVALKNIDANALKMPELHNHFLLKKRTGKLQSESTMFPNLAFADNVRRSTV